MWDVRHCGCSKHLPRQLNLKTERMSDGLLNGALSEQLRTLRHSVGHKNLMILWPSESPQH
jgi:hypothetical protein